MRGKSPAEVFQVPTKGPPCPFVVLPTARIEYNTVVQKVVAGNKCEDTSV